MNPFLAGFADELAKVAGAKMRAAGKAGNVLANALMLGGVGTAGALAYENRDKLKQNMQIMAEGARDHMEMSKREYQRRKRKDRALHSLGL
jgi:hypothetical protein